MLIAILVIVGIIYGIFHGMHSHANYRHHRRNGSRGLRLYWSSAMGPYASVRGPLGFRIGHKL
jgi:hypothetical protein